MDVPALYMQDARLLVGAGITPRKALANTSAQKVFQRASTILSMPEGERLQGDNQVLPKEEASSWIGMAREAA